MSHLIFSGSHCRAITPFHPLPVQAWLLFITERDGLVAAWNSWVHYLPMNLRTLTISQRLQWFWCIISWLLICVGLMRIWCNITEKNIVWDCISSICITLSLLSTLSTLTKTEGPRLPDRDDTLSSTQSCLSSDQPGPAWPVVLVEPMLRNVQPCSHTAIIILVSSAQSSAGLSHKYQISAADSSNSLHLFTIIAHAPLPTSETVED